MTSEISVGQGTVLGTANITPQAPLSSQAFGRGPELEEGTDCIGKEGKYIRIMVDRCRTEETANEGMITKAEAIFNHVK